MSTDKHTLHFTPFPPADDRLGIIKSRSVWPSLLTIGALTETRHPFATPPWNQQSQLFPTDLKGLERLESMLEQAQGGIRDAIKCIGVLMAGAGPEFKEDEQSVSSTGWLLCGLAELSACLQEQLDDVGFHLAERRADYETKPKEAPAARATKTVNDQKP